MIGIVLDFGPAKSVAVHIMDNPKTNTPLAAT
jgi:hypothetical protein